MIRRFLFDSGFSFVGQALTIVFGLASSIVIARVLGPELRGVLAIVLLLPLTIHALIGSGFSATVIHSIASRAWSESEIMPRLLGIWLYLTVIMLTTGVVALYFREVLFSGTPREFLIFSLALIPATLLQACTNCILVGKRAFRYQMYTRIVGAPVGFLLTLVLIWWLEFGVVGVIVAQLIGAVLSILLSLYWVPRLIGSNNIAVWPELRWSALKESLAFGIKSHVANLSAFLNYRADQFLVNGMLGSSAVGIYTIAVNNTERLWMLVGTFAQVLFPTASTKQDDPERFALFTARLAATMLFILTVAGGLLMFVAEFVVVLLYGEDFRPAGDVIVWLVPGIVCLGYSKVLANYIAGSGRPGVNAIRGIAALAVNLAANVILIPMYGIVGAAVATTISYSLSAAAGYIAFLRIAKVRWYEPILPPAKFLLELSDRVRK